MAVSAITCLTADRMPAVGAFDLPRKPRLVKAHRLNGTGQVESSPYDNAVSFTAHSFEAADIRSLAAVLTELSQRNDSVLIRGEPKLGYDQPGRRRTLENFRAVSGGVPWVMLDVDGVPVPDGVDPLSREAIEAVVAQLPEPFHGASYFYQFSASAGILKADGTPLKKGISVHLFFWLGGHLLDDVKLAAYLELHCLRSGFYWRRGKEGYPSIAYGIDLAVVRNSVQPHYIAPPIIGEGVQCRLAPEQRQALVVKERDTVVLPEPEEHLVAKAKDLRRKVDQDWKRECGWVNRSQVTRTASGAHRVQHYLSAPEVHTGRVFVGATRYGDSSIILEFEHEKSKGSWYVTQYAPTMAQRFGDGMQVPLRECSEGAYEYVRTKLCWFDEVRQDYHTLTADGFVKPLSTFVEQRSASLIVAPTGSGKTQAIIEYIREQPARSLRVFIYSAPTIPLCRQMVVDLERAGVPVVFYQDVESGHQLDAGVVVTTNKSLPRFVQMCLRQYRMYDCTLLIDEVHLGLDEFQRNFNSARNFAEAVENIDTCLFFTGTITDVQIAMLGQIVAKARRHGELVGHRFPPLKSNPLWVLDVADFDADVMVLFQRLGEVKRKGESLPRTVIAVDASKLDFYRELLAQHDLTDRAHVISRKESTEEQVMAAAGDVERPILVCSPIFSVGLNFASPPQIYWLAYQYLQIDENHIVQSLNRANRIPGQPPAEVRLYVHPPGEDVAEPPGRIALRNEAAELLGEETTLRTLMDGHFMLDRIAYNQSRNVERKTAAALTKLLDIDGFQNYRVEESPKLESEPVDVEELTAQAKILRKAVRDDYHALVRKAATLAVTDSWSYTVAIMDQAYSARQELRYGGTTTTQLDLDNCTQGGVMSLCGLSGPGQAAEVHVVRWRRLMALQLPFVSANFLPERRDQEHRQVAAEKVRAMIPLIGKLQALKGRTLDGRQFGSWMATKAGQDAVRALADNEADYIALSRMLMQLRKGTEAKRSNASKEARKKIDKGLFGRASEFLASIGVVFEKKDPSSKTSPFDPSKPLVPDWDFDAMEVALERLAQSLEAMDCLPAAGDADGLVEDLGVVAELCEACVHQDPHGECRLAHPTANHLHPWWAQATACADHKPMSRALRARVDALNAQVPADGEVLPNRYTPYAVLHERIWGGTA